MFENLVAQDELLASLKPDVAAGRLPPALLFSGPPGSGKLTAALELARALSCDAPRSPGSETAPWGCACPSCSRHRVLAHPDLMLFGSRSFPEEVGAALELLARKPGKASSFFFARAARKLVRRFDPALYEGEESKLAKALPLVREIEEGLEAVAAGAAEAEAAPAAARRAAGEKEGREGAAAARVAESCAKLEALVPEAPPVFMVRNAEVWARLAPMGRRKTVVVENADRMLDSARNALLKILEEPPETVRFVLLSSRRVAMMGTILSRSRTYTFKRRSAEETALVLERVFRSGEPAPSVESFLAARRAFPPAEARERAGAFLASALAARAERGPLPRPLAILAEEAEAEGRGPSVALAEILEATKDFGQRDDRFASSFKSFLAALAERLGTILRSGELDGAGLALVERWAELLREARGDYESWNRSPSLLAEALMYAIAEAR